MKIITVRGWNEGFQKVGFTQMLRRELGYSLAQAKSATDAILENKSWAFFARAEDSGRLLLQMTELGARVSRMQNFVRMPASRSKKTGSAELSGQLRTNKAVSSARHKLFRNRTRRLEWRVAGATDLR